MWLFGIIGTQNFFLFWAKILDEILLHDFGVNFAVFFSS